MAIAHEAGVELRLETFNEVADRTPHLVKLSPSGPQLHGGPAPGRRRHGRAEPAGRGRAVDGSVPTIAGVDLADAVPGGAGARRRRSSVRWPSRTAPPAVWPCSSATWRPGAPWSRSRPCCPRCWSTGVRPWSSTTRPRSSRPSRRTGSPPGSRGRHPLRRTQGRPRACRRCSRPRRLWPAPGSTRAWRSSPTAASAARAGERASATWRPRRCDGGPIALVRDGDIIAIDIPGRTLTLEVGDAELEREEGGVAAPGAEVSRACCAAT